jgi:hypothetical protein
VGDAWDVTGTPAWDVFAREEIDRLRAQVADLLPWAQIGATRGRTEANWEDAVRMTARIEGGEFD